MLPPPARRIEGTIHVPLFLDDPGPGGRLVLDANGTNPAVLMAANGTFPEFSVTSGGRRILTAHTSAPGRRLDQSRPATVTFSPTDPGAMG